VGGRKGNKTDEKFRFQLIEKSIGESAELTHDEINSFKFNLSNIAHTPRWFLWCNIAIV